MQFKLLVATAFVSFVAAATVPAGQCNTGPVQCCDSVQDANSDAATALFHKLGITAESVTGQVGITCSPVSVIGVGGNSCSAQPVCCQNNNFNGLVALGCTPINVNL
ncbi:fungal hydrophobin [Dendrothele bispora CBS 962.96]|uniref:Hydrophobin n=1 Tax=Dendrothele bispora (strain CBS 962.96) TaxID=1314807 RepID=A0A4S8MI69_DENBC|nr:fungal hydrophobin [Dendrothele bispora CBS 962.96]